MASNKINRINEDIKFVLSKLLREIKDPRISSQGLISITSVETTGDLRYCKVYLSVLDPTSEKELKRGLRSASGWLRHELSSALDLRYTPELIFELDRSIEHGAHISKLINELDLPEENGDDGEKDIDN